MATDDWKALSFDQLTERIDVQKKIVRALQSDYETPHNLQRDVEQSRQRAETIAAEIDAQIAGLQAQLKTLQESRDAKVADATKRAAAKAYRLANIKTLLCDEAERLEAMQAHSKLIENSGKLERLQSLQRKVLELQAQLPGELQKLSPAELELMINMMGESK